MGSVGQHEKLPVPPQAAEILLKTFSKADGEGKEKRKQDTPDPQELYVAEQRLMAVQLNLQFLANSTLGPPRGIATDSELNPYALAHWGQWEKLHAVLMQVCKS